jgi:RNA 2',3'-cyclic 3'-phosphodiesterase
VSREPLRAFLAVDLPSAVRSIVSEAMEGLRTELPEDVRWVDGGKLHLTLKFIAALETTQVPRLLRSAATKLLRTEPFDVELGGLGAFPSARQARVLWLGVTSGATQLARAARRLDAAAARVGAERDRRPYRAHLTLARLRDPLALPLERLIGPEPLRFPVEEVVLYESRLASSGSTYIPLARLPLGRAQDDFYEDIAPDDLN